MKLWNRIFGKNKQNHDNNAATISIGDRVNSMVSVPEDLFIEKTPPTQSAYEPVTTKNGISLFLEQDFYSRGYRDGYSTHTREKKEVLIRGIKSEFRLELDKEIDIKQKARLELTDLKLDSNGLLDTVDKQLDDQIKEMDSILERYKAELTASSQDEGWIMIALHRYCDGYTRGMEAYLQEKRIGLSTGLFN